LFVHENYEIIKKNHADVPSKDIISIMARQWASISDEEKQIWKYRADQMKDQYAVIDASAPGGMAAMNDQSETMEDDIQEAFSDDGGGKKRATIKKVIANKSVSV
jgi:hypothetical protein